MIYFTIQCDNWLFRKACEELPTIASQMQVNVHDDMQFEAENQSIHFFKSNHYVMSVYQDFFIDIDWLRIDTLSLLADSSPDYYREFFNITYHQKEYHIGRIHAALIALQPLYRLSFKENMPHVPPLSMHKVSVPKSLDVLALPRHNDLSNAVQNHRSTFGVLNALFQDFAGVIIGEPHGDFYPANFFKNHASRLNELNVSVIFVEGIYDELQPIISTWPTDQPIPLAWQAQFFLNQKKVPGTRPYEFMLALEALHQAGIKLIGIDAAENSINMNILKYMLQNIGSSHVTLWDKQQINDQVRIALMDTYASRVIQAYLGKHDVSHYLVWIGSAHIGICSDTPNAPSEYGLSRALNIPALELIDSDRCSAKNRAPVFHIQPYNGHGQPYQFDSNCPIVTITSCPGDEEILINSQQNYFSNNPGQCKIDLHNAHAGIASYEVTALEEVSLRNLRDTLSSCALKIGRSTLNGFFKGVVKQSVPSQYVALTYYPIFFGINFLYLLYLSEEIEENDSRLAAARQAFFELSLLFIWDKISFYLCKILSKNMNCYVTEPLRKGGWGKTANAMDRFSSVAIPAVSYLTSAYPGGLFNGLANMCSGAIAEKAGEKIAGECRQIVSKSIRKVVSLSYF